MGNGIRQNFILALERSFTRINHPRLFETERGYQGALITELNKESEHFDRDLVAIIEQEYQKRLKEHGIRIRPDIIIHVPFNPAIHNSRTDDNLVAIELKLNASEEEALSDLRNLSSMCDILNYPLAVFININSQTTHISYYDGENKDKLVAYWVTLKNEQVTFGQEQATA